MTLTQINRAGLDADALDRVFTIGASGSSAYTFQGEGLNGTVNNPTLYLTRGKTYRFENGSGGHPIRIQSTSGASGTAYNTGVTNNAGSGTVIVEVQHDAPDVLYYQCTSHAAMNGILYITGALADGGVTTAKIADDAVTTDKIADNAVTVNRINNGAVTEVKLATGAVTATKIGSGQVTNAKLANDAVTTARIADDAVTQAKLADSSVGGAQMRDNAIATAEIQDGAVTLAKLENGTSSNDGKFLRANNGADPTFETVTGTTINNNANNRVITGSDTANTLEAESNIVVDAGGRLGVGTSTPVTGCKLTVAGNGLAITGQNVAHGANSLRIGEEGSGVAQLRAYGPDASTNGSIQFTCSRSDGSNSKNVNIDSSGRVGIGTNNPDQKLKIEDSSDVAIHILKTGSQDTLLKNTGQTELCAASGGASGQRIAFKIGANTGSLSDIAKFTDTGLCFGSDTAAANALDDYEEGTWTPTLHGTWYNSGVFNNAVYTKIGRIVHVSFDLYRSANNMGWQSGASIRGFPFGVYSSGYITTATLTTFSYTSSSARFVENYFDSYSGGNLYLHTNNQSSNIRHLWCNLTYTTT